MTGYRNNRLYAGDRPRAPVFRVIAAYVSANAVPPDRLGSLIADVSAALVGLQPATATARAEAPRPSPVARPPVATPTEIHSSVTPEGLRSFEDGKHYRMLRRHLRSCGLDPDAYRSKWGLPPDYPMTCPIYSERRSIIAQRARLGQIKRA